MVELQVPIELAAIGYLYLHGIFQWFTIRINRILVTNMYGLYLVAFLSFRSSNYV